MEQDVQERCLVGWMKVHLLLEKNGYMAPPNSTRQGLFSCCSYLFLLHLYYPRIQKNKNRYTIQKWTDKIVLNGSSPSKLKVKRYEDIWTLNAQKLNAKTEAENVKNKYVDLSQYPCKESRPWETTSLRPIAVETLNS